MLRTSEQPHSRLTWLDNPGVAESLCALATGTIPLSHDALAAQPHWRRAMFLRELLMHCGALPTMDKNLLLFQRWLNQRLATIDDPDHHALVQRFATWNELRRLRAKADRQPLTSATIRTSRERVTQAIHFLAWLHSRGDTPASCQQPSIDAWFAENYNTRKPTEAFLPNHCNRSEFRPESCEQPPSANSSSTSLPPLSPACSPTTKTAPHDWQPTAAPGAATPAQTPRCEA
jgi:hypothetical protein